MFGVQTRYWHQVSSLSSRGRAVTAIAPLPRYQLLGGQLDFGGHAGSWPNLLSTTTRGADRHHLGTLLVQGFWRRLDGVAEERLNRSGARPLNRMSETRQIIGIIWSVHTRTKSYFEHGLEYRMILIPPSDSNSFKISIMLLGGVIRW